MTYTLPTGNESIAGLYVWAANTTNGISSLGILLIVLAVAFFGTQRFGAQVHHSILVSWLAMTMIAGALMVMGALSSLVVSICVGVLAIIYWWASQQ